MFGVLSVTDRTGKAKFLQKILDSHNDTCLLILLITPQSLWPSLIDIVLSIQ